ncbi:MAG: small multi-drug export protein [Patescibacteria group bacterium]|nr:small multi-drug export protein [Patescibacteria group bacterium]
MIEKLVELLSGVPSPLAVLIISTIPIGELRASIPVGIFTYHLNVLPVFVFSVIGNLLPVIFILLFLQRADNFLRKKSKTFAGFFDWLYKRTYKRGGERFKKLGAIALILFVAIPLPMTGAWTGAVLASLFNVEFKKAFPLITLGVIISGIIVSLASVFAHKIIF